MDQLSPFQPKPLDFDLVEYRRSYLLSYSPKQVADWLNDPKTFTKGQIPPYRVEFIDADGQRAAFEKGVFTNHHGPFLSANGILGEIDHLNYRDLRYFYGSYVLSFRLIRPTRLQFWIEPQEENQSRLIMQLDSYVRPWFKKFYRWGLGLFFTSFEQMANRALKRQAA